MPTGSPRNNPARSRSAHLGVVALERPSYWPAGPNDRLRVPGAREREAARSAPRPSAGEAAAAGRAEAEGVARAGRVCPNVNVQARARVGRLGCPLQWLLAQRIRRAQQLLERPTSRSSASPGSPALAARRTS